MSERIRRLTSRQVERILSAHGFHLISQQGSHRKWRYVEQRLQVIVPEHKGKTLPLGTLRNIFVSARIPEDQWKS
jgi:predicted RNA binding protein YcfA (HicA-like mRNA interferase family)